MSTLVNTISWLANGYLLVGYWALGRKRHDGGPFVWLGVGCALWAIAGFISHQWALVAINVVLGAINVRNHWLEKTHD